MASSDVIDSLILEDDLNSRPRRSCAKKEGEFKEERYKFSDDESEDDEIVVDKGNDEDFKIGSTKKKVKKSKKKKSKDKRKNDKPTREAPTYLSVMRAHRNFERQFEEEAEDEEYSSSNDDDQSECSDSKEEQAVPIKEETPPPPPAKKKKIVIRPWNPVWYTMPSNTSQK